MTYCLGIVTREGLVLASDRRTNAGLDQINKVRKMHIFERPGDRVFVILSSGSLSCSQSIITLLRQDFDTGRGMASSDTFYDAVREVGNRVREVALLDREALERDDFSFNVSLIVGGQIRNQPHQLYMVYPQGNPVRATEECPFLQIGEVKYGRPILDRGVQYEKTTLSDAVKYALISLDSTMRSNLTVGPPIDLLKYSKDALSIHDYRVFPEGDKDLLAMRQEWENHLREAVQDIPSIAFERREPDPALNRTDSDAAKP
jgi:putative proteasome-type protease